MSHSPISFSHAFVDPCTVCTRMKPQEEFGERGAKKCQVRCWGMQRGEKRETCGMPLRTMRQAQRGLCDRCAWPREESVELTGAFLLAAAVIGLARTQGDRAFLRECLAEENVWGQLVQFAASRSGLTKE